MIKRIIAIIRLKSYEKAVAIADALVAGGILELEFTLTGSGALEAIKTIKKHGGCRVGAGTILNTEDAKRAISAGSDFVVTPTLHPEVVAELTRQKIESYCGAFTPTEALAAHNAGANFIKIFPARALGPQYIKEILGPLPFLKLVPTGGVIPENIHEWFKAGAAAVGVGSNLVSQELVDGDNFAELTNRAREMVAKAAT